MNKKIYNAKIRDKLEELKMKCNNQSKFIYELHNAIKLYENHSYHE